LDKRNQLPSQFQNKNVRAHAKLYINYCNSISSEVQTILKIRTLPGNYAGRLYKVLE
jgi:hypothetical protein